MVSIMKTLSHLVQNTGREAGRQARRRARNEERQGRIRDK
jgi:hypothetical protein